MMPTIQTNCTGPRQTTPFKITIQMPFAHGIQKDLWMFRHLSLVSLQVCDLIKNGIFYLGRNCLKNSYYSSIWA
jgi:hypothetical protein